MARVGVVLTAAVRVLDPAPVGWLVPALLVAAAAWQVAPTRRRLLRRCGSVRLHAAGGPAADVDCVRAGVRAGGLCVAGCGVAMLPMAVLPMGPRASWSWPACSALLLRERAAGPDPATRAGRPHEAVALLALALVVSLGRE